MNPSMMCKLIDTMSFPYGIFLQSIALTYDLYKSGATYNIPKTDIATYRLNPPRGRCSEKLSVSSLDD